MERFNDTDPTQRPYIPKQNTSKKLASIVEHINTEILPNFLSNDQDFTITHQIIYCAAYTTAITNGSRIREESTQNYIQPQTPAWQKRLMNKIKCLRQDIGRLTQYIKGNRGRKLVSRIEKIKEKNKTHSQHEEPNTQNEHFLDTLKQKLNTASNRLSRYLACTNRKKQNAQFYSTEKQFYRTLKTNHETPQTTTPPAETLHKFWADIWENPVEFNRNATWINENAEHTNSIAEMTFESVPVDTFIKVLKRTHNWKAPGTDNIHNYWYKKFTSVHPILHNHIHKFISSPDTLPTFITQGVTYMLPKDNADTENPAKYRPITCLQTIYKIITSCVSEVVNQHLDSQGILAEEQKGARKYSQGCKEQLIIDAVAMRQAHKQKRDIKVK